MGIAWAVIIMIAFVFVLVIGGMVAGIIFIVKAATKDKAMDTLGKDFDRAMGSQPRQGYPAQGYPGQPYPQQGQPMQNYSQPYQQGQSHQRIGHHIYKEMRHEPPRAQSRHQSTEIDLRNGENREQEREDKNYRYEYFRFLTV